MSADDFYSRLPECRDFGTDDVDHDFVPVPADWVVLAADIVQSRVAIAEGRYKQVNMVGAAVIAAVLNVLGRERVPFVFGGDGAVLLVPENAAGPASQAIAGVVGLTREVMGLELRAAAIPVADIRRKGGDFRIRKYSLSPGNHLAMILGDGLLVTDRILKDPEAVTPYALAEHRGEPVLDGLSCRWEPLPALNGHIASVIVKPANNTDLPRILEGITAQLGFDPLADDDRVKLAEKPRLRFRFPPRGLALEARFSGRGHWVRRYLSGLLESVAFVYAYITGFRVGPFDPGKYMAELGLNTDHRKLGDSLQLVLDLTPRQLASLTAHLEAEYDSGRLVFGLHVSSAALMTCFVQDVGNNQHIHFVDGADGGLSVAATDFKERQLLSAQRAIRR